MPPAERVGRPDTGEYAASDEGTGHAEPAGPDSVTWHLAYRTGRGDEVLATATTEYRW